MLVQWMLIFSKSINDATQEDVCAGRNEQEQTAVLFFTPCYNDDVAEPVLEDLLHVLTISGARRQVAPVVRNISSRDASTLHLRALRQRPSHHDIFTIIKDQDLAVGVLRYSYNACKCFATEMPHQFHGGISLWGEEIMTRLSTVSLFLRAGGSCAGSGL